MRFIDACYRVGLGLMAPTIVGMACSSAPAKAPEMEPSYSPVVRAVSAEKSSVPALALRGNVEAGSRFRLSFQVSGQIRRIAVREGEQVRKGQLVASLHGTREVAQLQASQATLERARRAEDRAAQLEKGAVVSRVAREEAATQLELAEVNTSLAEDALRFTELRASADGIVTKRWAEPGEVIAPGTPIVTIEESVPSYVRVGVTDRELPRVQLGMSATVDVDGEDKPVSMVVSSVAPSPGDDGLYEIRLAPHGEASQWMRSGALVRVSLPNVVQTTEISVPLSAVVRRANQEWIVKLVEPGPTAATALVPVQLGRASGRSVVITRGLVGGERLVAEGAFFLEAGQKVQVLEQ